MKKKSPKTKKIIDKKKTILGVLALVLLVIVFLFGRLIYLKLNPVYRPEDRVGKIEEKQEIYKEKVVGWLQVSGTNIDYPVIYNDDDINVNKIGYDFLWTNESSMELGNREVIFGHNILNVSKTPLITDKSHKKFEQLMSFIYYDFAKENQYLQYTINGESYIYKIFAVGFVEDKKLPYYEKNFEKDRLEKYIKDAKNDSFYDYKVDVDNNDDIISLVTCTRFYGLNANIDFKIDARKLRKHENISKYKVAESAKYDKIKEEMKGDEADEKV